MIIRSANVDSVKSWRELRDMKRLLFLIALSLLFSTIHVHGQFRKSRERASQEEKAEDAGLNYANPAEYTIGGIDVVGLQVLDKNAIISLTGLRVGDKVKIPGDQISNAVRKLWKHGLVGDVSIEVERFEGLNVFLLVRLAERPRLSDFYFTGISKGRQSTLKEDLTLIRGKIVNDAMIRNTELAVKKHFVKKGFLNTQVKISQVGDTVSRGNIRLHIDIDLKQKVKIHEVAFEGNDNVSSSTLKRKLKKTHEYPRLTLHRAIIGSVLSFRPGNLRQWMDSTYDMSWRDIGEFLNQHVKLNVFNGSKFIRSDFEEDKVKLISYYNSQGFRDAEILADTIVAYDDKSIDVRFRLSEGQKYYFRNITWTGNYIHSAVTLNKILDIKKGDVYNNELLQRKTTFNPKGADISGLYMDDGYLFFHVVPVEVNVSGDSIDVEMRIHEGDQATIDEVIISGNDRTSDHVIRRELYTIPGQKFRRSDLIRTQQQLAQMGYFDPQKIEQDVRPSPDGTVDIEWKLVEQSNDQIQLSGGWGGFYGFVGTLGVTFNNFSVRNIPHLEKWRPLPVGDGQRFALAMQANGKSFQSYSVSFTEPWLGGRQPNSFTVSFNHSMMRRPTVNFTFSDNSSLKQTGATIGLGRRLSWPDNYFSLVNTMAFLVYNYKNYFSSTSLPAVGRTYDLALESTLSRNSIDNPMYPASGSTVSLSLKITPPWSSWKDASFMDDINKKYEWVEMHKWMLDMKYYLTIIGSKKPGGRALVLESKAHFGFIGSYNKALGAGPFGRYLLGGDGLAGGFNAYVLGQDIIGLRGYENNLVTPPDYAGSGGVLTDRIQGGTVYNKLGLELRYPVTTGQAATIYGFVFTEAGNNWDNYKEFNPFNLYKSAGVGARIFMPAFGLIGLNWAYGFDRLPGAPAISGSQFHFTIGQQIR